MPSTTKFLGKASDFTTDVPDNAATGGNVRGAQAVDLQLVRNAATQVANGAQAVLAGGVNNTSSGTQSVVGGGSTNTASGAQAGVLAGVSNTASGATSAVVGGTTNTASGISSVVRGGNNNTASGINSEAGGAYASTNGRTYSRSFGSGFGATLGRYQEDNMVLAASLTGTATVNMTSDGAAAATANQLTLQNNSALMVRGRIIVRDTVTNDAMSFEISVLIKRGANAAATSIVGTPTVTTLFADTAATGTLAVVADTTNGALQLQLTGFGANLIRATAHLSAAEVA